MDIEQMRRSPVGALVPISGTDSRSGRAYSHFGFVPEPLGEIPNLTAGTWQAVVRATDALSRLDQVARISGARELAEWMSAPLLRLEAQSTSAIEGTFEPARAVLEIDEDDERAQSASMREILNYVRAARQCFQYASAGRALTVGIVCELQGMLVTGTAAAGRDAGAIRTSQVAIGAQSGTVEQARFVPMPPGHGLASALGSLIDWSRGRSPYTGTTLVDLAMFHYQFETIHPFADGNGRIGRMLLVHELMRCGALSEPLLTLSPWIERHDGQYRDGLFGVSAHGDWSTWVSFIARAVEMSARDVLSKIQRVHAIADEMHDAVSGARAGSATRRLPALLVRHPVVSVRDVAESLECSTPPATQAIESLEKLGFLVEVTGGTYGRRWAANAILDALLAREADAATGELAIVPSVV